MSMLIVFQQMLVVFIMMIIGYYIFRTGRISEKASMDLSGLITDVCNPALIISSVFDQNNGVSKQDLLLTGAIAVVYYIGLILLGILLVKVLRIDKKERKFYHLMTVYGNIGFIGVPFISAVLGASAVIYLSVFILVFNILTYTHGIQTLAVSKTGKVPWRKMVNPGTISSVLAIVLFLMKVQAPVFIKDSLTYMGRCTTFLSMVVLGISMASIPLKTIVSDVKLYLFAAIRFLGVPVVVTLLLKPWIQNEILLGVITLTLALPVANMPLMMAQQNQQDTSTLAKGIVLTTLLSMVTVTLASGVL